MSTLTANALCNVSLRLAQQAAAAPRRMAIAEPLRRNPAGREAYRTIDFGELEHDVARLAAGLRACGAEPGRRYALLVRPGIDSVALVFAMLRSGAVSVLIDPGMGRRNFLRCLAEVDPHGFIGVPAAQLARRIFARRFPNSHLHVTVGGRWNLGGIPLEEVRRRGESAPPIEVATGPDDPAAVIFTTGSTGPPKGVQYTHRMFDEQLRQIGAQYHVEPGGVDLPGFPLFGLFNAALGVTTIVPDMDPTRPASVDPRKIVRAMQDWGVTQAFGSPAMWNRVGGYCRERGVRIPTLRRVLSAGASVPAEVIRAMRSTMAEEGEMHTPYGATESLPVATISASEVLGETQARTERGAGVCVGRRFPDLEWKVVRIVDGPIPSLADAEELPTGEVGELIVCGAVASREYVTRTEWNALSIIADGERFWRRIGDVGYLDEQDRFWMCGRAQHRVRTDEGELYTEQCEPIFNTHPDVYRSALVGIGPAGSQFPAIIVEPRAGRFPRSSADRERMAGELAELAARHETTRSIATFLMHRSLPVDIRHNSKIFREQLAVWAVQELGRRKFGSTILAAGAGMVGAGATR